MTEIDLLAIDKGAVVAPAGCGKTHHVLAAAQRHSDRKPLLVLTHTNAGVAALRGRLAKAGVPTSRYQLATIDGWAMRLVRLFPVRSREDPAILEVRNPSSDYLKIRRGAASALADGQLGDVLSATYSRLIVDEYQDCTATQHQILVSASRSLPTCVLGDPMQGIFGFAHNDPLPSWGDVCAEFPVVGELSEPWRWRNAGADHLGVWLLDARQRLLAGHGVDLSTAPDNIEWRRLDGRNDAAIRRAAAMTRPASRDQTIVVIGDATNPASHRLIASQTPGAMTVEAVELRDLISFAETFNPAAPGSLEHLLSFVESVTVNADVAGLRSRLRALQARRGRSPATPSEAACLEYLARPSLSAAATVLHEAARRPRTRVHRAAIFGPTERALAASSSKEALLTNAVSERERFRMTGRTLPPKAVGSTLLLKGLEADVAVILNADALSKHHLYVAMTRGARRVVVCARSGILGLT